MRIGELAKRTGLDPPTIRYYESLGLLKPVPRSPSGYRQYSPADLERLAFIQHNRTLGFTLREIGLLAPLHSVVTQLVVPTTDGSPELQSIVAMLEDKQQAIDGKIGALRKLRREVRGAIKLVRSQPAAVCPASARPRSQR